MRIQRYRQIITHKSPTRREITDEITVHNDTDVAIENLLIVSVNDSNYRMYLRVIDNDGAELAIIPSSFLTEVFDSDDLPEDGTTQKLGVSFGPKRKILPNETRVIRMVYQDAKLPINKLASIFNKPLFNLKENIQENEDTRLFYTVVAPDGFEIKLGKVEPEQDGNEKYYLNKGRSALDISIRTSANLDSFALDYMILPDRGDRWPLSAMLFLYILSVVLTVFVAKGFLDQYTFFSSLTNTLTTNLKVVVGSEVAIGIGYLALVTNPLTHRIKIIVIAVVVAFLIALLF